MKNKKQYAKGGKCIGYVKSKYDSLCANCGSNKSSHSYARGGEIDYGEIREKLRSLDLPTDAGDRTELVEQITERYGIDCSEVIRASSDDDVYVAVDGLLRDYGIYAQGGEEYAKGGMIDKDIAKFKKQLISKEKSRGLYENFGQKEVSKIKDKYDSYERDDMGVQNATKIQDFSDWASGYDGTRYAKGGVLLEQLKGEREFNPKMNMTDAQINDLVQDVKDEVKEGKSKGDVLLEQLKGEREFNPKMNMTDAQINDLVQDVKDEVKEGKSFAKGGMVNKIIGIARTQADSTDTETYIYPISADVPSKFYNEVGFKLENKNDTVRVVELYIDTKEIVLQGYDNEGENYEDIKVYKIDSLSEGFQKWIAKNLIMKTRREKGKTKSYFNSYAKGGEVSRSDMEEWFYEHDNEWQNDIDIDHQQEDTNLDLVEWAYNRYHYAKGGKLDNSFKSAKDYENYLRKGGKPFDSVVIDKEEFHQDYYDMSGKKISYSPYTYPINKRRTLDIETSNRYENGFGDAEVEIYAKGGKTEGDIDEAMYGMDKWLPDDEYGIKLFQDIEDDGDVEDMIEYLNSYSNEEVLSERYGVTNSDFPEMAKKIMKKSFAKGGKITDSMVWNNMGYGGDGEIIEHWASDVGGSNQSVDNIITYSNGKNYLVTTNFDQDMLVTPSKTATEWEDDDYAKGGRIKVGTFNEEQMTNKEDKVATEKARKESGLNYTDTKLYKKKGKYFLDVFLIPNEEYYNSSKFSEGGKVEKKENNEMLIGGIAGVLLGIFLNK